MPTASTTSAREILTGLHDVMASRASARRPTDPAGIILSPPPASSTAMLDTLPLLTPTDFPPIVRGRL
ncbi:MAG: hypothetical protein ACK40O_08970, partial [Allosphingosinicella sp.]